jgi:hypothetical protein
MRLILIPAQLVFCLATTVGCAKTLYDPQGAKVASDSAYHRTVARNNDLRRDFYEKAASGRGFARLQRVWQTTDDQPILDVLTVDHGKVTYSSHYFFDTFAPMELRLMPQKEMVSNLQLGYVDPPGSVPTPERDLSSSQKFVPVSIDSPAPPDRELILRFDFHGVQKPSVGRF